MLTSRIMPSLHLFYQRIKKGKRKHEDSESCQKPSKAVKVESIIRDARVPVTIYHDATTASPTSPTPQDGRKVVTKDTLTTEIMDQEAHDLMVSGKASTFFVFFFLLFSILIMRYDLRS